MNIVILPEPIQSSFQLSSHAWAPNICTNVTENNHLTAQIIGLMEKMCFQLQTRRKQCLPSYQLILKLVTLNLVWKLRKKDTCKCFSIVYITWSFSIFISYQQLVISDRNCDEFLRKKALCNKLKFRIVNSNLVYHAFSQWRIYGRQKRQLLHLGQRQEKNPAFLSLQTKNF